MSKSTKGKSTPVIVDNKKNAVEVSTNYKYSVVDGTKTKGLASKVLEYLEKCLAWNKDNMTSIQVGYNSFIKELANYDDDKAVVTATSLDLHKAIFDACYELAKQAKANGSARILVLKANKGDNGTLCTVPIGYYSQYYGTADKKAESIAKAKATREKNDKAKADKKADDGDNGISIEIDNGTKATSVILQLIAKYGDTIDTTAIYTALDGLLCNAKADDDKAVVIA